MRAISIRTLIRALGLIWLAGFLAGAAPALAGERCVTDDKGREVCLEAPAERIISLSPGATELLFAVGAGEQVVGAMAHSDYPEQAKDIPRIGSHQRLDMEAILSKAPDLIVAWASGNPAGQLEELEGHGATIYYSEPRALDDVAVALERLGRLTGQEARAEEVAAEYRGAIAALEEKYADAEPIRVFYEVWPEPLQTLNDEHLISRVANMCGGENIFGDLERLSPRVDRESVLEADPEAIFTGGSGEADESWLESWKRYEDMTAVKRGNLFFVPPSSIQRPTPRLIDGARVLCEELEEARERL